MAARGPLGDCTVLTTPRLAFYGESESIRAAALLSGLSIYLMGLAVHAVMLLDMLLVPADGG